MKAPGELLGESALVILGAVLCCSVIWAAAHYRWQLTVDHAVLVVWIGAPLWGLLTWAGRSQARLEIWKQRERDRPS